MRRRVGCWLAWNVAVRVYALADRIAGDDTLIEFAGPATLNHFECAIDESAGLKDQS